MSVWIGTEKQIKWAGTIKEKVIEIANHEWLQDICETYDRSEQMVALATQFIDKLERNPNASYWINHFKDTRKHSVIQELSNIFFE